MTIGLVLSNPPGYSETFFRSKIKGLQEHGMKVILLSRSSGDFDLCPVKVQPKVSRNPILQGLYFMKVYLSLLPHLKSVRRYIKLEWEEGTAWGSLFKKIYLNAHILKTKVDWLHFGFATMALGSETVAKAIGAKMAVSFRGYDMTVYPVKNPGCYERMWKYVDKIHSLSDYLINEAKKHGMPEQITTTKITPAVNVDLFRSKDENLKKEAVPVILTVGRLHWIKNYPQVLEALAFVAEKGYNFEYRIIGDGSEWERIAFTAYDLGIQDNVRFLGRIPHQEVQKQLVTASIYLQYSLQEGFCNAVLEAQAMGKLCIVSDAEGLSENVLHEETGWVVPRNKPTLLADQIIKVLELLKGEQEVFSKRAIARVRKEFNLEKQRREFVEFYEN